MPHDRLGLFDSPPNRTEIRLALAVTAVLVAALLAILPVSAIRLREVVPFIPVIDAIMFVSELIIATTLYTQAAVYRSRALSVLASSFVFMALLLVPHALTFPGAFTPDGLLGAGLSSTAWTMIFRRIGFPIAVILYVVLKRSDTAARPEIERPPATVLRGVLGAIALAAAATVLAIRGDDLLPPMFFNHIDMNRFNITVYALSAIALVGVAMVILFLNRKSVLDLWLLVALVGWQVQSVLNLSVHSRFTVGFYCLFIVMLVSRLIVLLALIVESNQLYARLAVWAAARDRDLETRMMSMDAVAAAISHEVGQPLAAVTLSASAGLNWLTRAQPDHEMAITALHDTIDAGGRAVDVLKSIRATFSKKSGSLSDFNLNDLVRETATLLDRELAAQRVSLRLVLDESLPSILANRVQLQRVLVNLLTNAIESVGTTRRQTRRIEIRSASLDNHQVLVEVSDSGAGIAPEKMAHIFEPFVTTKSTGTGLGLSLSRTIVEEHGGGLWASPGEKHGAIFHVQLPRSPPA